MPKSTTFSNDLLKLIYNGTPIATLADNAGTSPAGNLYAALHSADPGAGGNQSTNEVSYTGYSRPAIARTSAGFTVSGQSVSLASTVSFPAGTGGAGSALFFSIGTAQTGAGKITHYGVLGTGLGAFSGATNGNITIPGNGLAVNDRVVFFAPPVGSLPAGITSGTVYYVLSVTGDVITISTTQGGSAVAITASGDGIAYKVLPVTLGASITPQLATGTTITES